MCLTNAAQCSYEADAFLWHQRKLSALSRISADYTQYGMHLPSGPSNNGNARVHLHHPGSALICPQKALQAIAMALFRSSGAHLGDRGCRWQPLHAPLRC